MENGSLFFREGSAESLSSGITSDSAGDLFGDGADIAKLIIDLVQALV